MTIYYAVEPRWLRKRKDTVIDGVTTHNRVVQAVQHLFGSTPFVWQDNKSFQDNPFGDAAQRLPSKPHGLNGYSHINGIAVLSATNPAPDHFHFLDSIGMEGGEVRTGGLFQRRLPIGNADLP